MASLNLRKVPDDLKRELKSEAAHRGWSLEDYCLGILRQRSALGYETALSEKNRGSSGAAARGPVIDTSTDSAPSTDPKFLAALNTGRTKRLATAARAQEALREQGMADEASARSLIEAAHRTALPQDPAPAKKSREIPPDTAERCPVCFGLLPYHQKGCKNA